MTTPSPSDDLKPEALRDWISQRIAEDYYADPGNVDATSDAILAELRRRAPTTTNEAGG